MAAGTIIAIIFVLCVSKISAQIYTYESSACQNCSTCYTIANPSTANSQCYQGNVTQITVNSDGIATNMPLLLATCGLCTTIGYDYYFMLVFLIVYVVMFY